MQNALENYIEIKLLPSRGCSTEWRDFSADWRCSTAWAAVRSTTVSPATAASISVCNQYTNNQRKNYEQLHFV